MPVGSCDVQWRLAEEVERYVAGLVSLVEEELCDRSSVQEAGEVKIRVSISTRRPVIVVEEVGIML